MQLAFVRRIEAISARAWPAAATTFDGAWAVRLTGSHPSKRLNSVNPLDPGDTADMGRRIERARTRFDAMGRPLVFRISPLAPDRLAARFERHGWRSFDRTLVMTASLDDMDLDDAPSRIGLSDPGRWIEAAIAVGAFPADRRPGTFEIIARAGGPSGVAGPATSATAAAGIRNHLELHLVERDDDPAAVCLSVRFLDTVGILQVATAPHLRRQGLGRSLLVGALANARRAGAKTAWLQVLDENVAAIDLYRSLGFGEAYAYDYRIAPEDDPRPRRTRAGAA